MALITSMKGIEGSDSASKAPLGRTIDDGPPESSEKPKVAKPKGSLFQQDSRGQMDQNSMGLGSEGGSTQILANQALAQILTGIRTLSTVLPGLVPVLSDLTGRLSMIVPQMINDLTNGGSGLVPSMGMPNPTPTQLGPMSAGMPPSGPMQGGGMPPGVPQAPPMGQMGMQ